MRHPPILKDEDAVLEAARSGDPDAFEQLVAEHRPSLHAHSYRMLGSGHDADDALQEALLRAWRAIPRFEGRSSVRTWLYRIATNASLDLMDRRHPRVVQIGDGPGADPHDGSNETVEIRDGRPGPDVRYEQREAVELAFEAAQRLLTRSQRAALILREVLGYSAAETADALDTSVASVNSALQRARSTLESWAPERDRVDARPPVGRPAAVPANEAQNARRDTRGRLDQSHHRRSG